MSHLQSYFSYHPTLFIHWYGIDIPKCTLESILPTDQVTRTTYDVGDRVHVVANSMETKRSVKATPRLFHYKQRTTDLLIVGEAWVTLASDDELTYWNESGVCPVLNRFQVDELYDSNKIVSDLKEHLSTQEVKIHHTMCSGKYNRKLCIFRTSHSSLPILQSGEPCPLYLTHDNGSRPFAVEVHPSSVNVYINVDIPSVLTDYFDEDTCEDDSIPVEKLQDYVLTHSNGDGADDVDYTNITISAQESTGDEDVDNDDDNDREQKIVSYNSDGLPIVERTQSEEDEIRRCYPLCLLSIPKQIIRQIFVPLQECGNCMLVHHVDNCCTIIGSRITRFQLADDELIETYLSPVLGSDLSYPLLITNKKVYFCGGKKIKEYTRDPSDSYSHSTPWYDLMFSRRIPVQETNVTILQNRIIH